jgi:hypothetical protein
MTIRRDGENLAGADAVVNSELERVYNYSPFWLMKKRGTVTGRRRRWCIGIQKRLWPIAAVMVRFSEVIKACTYRRFFKRRKNFFQMNPASVL